MNARTKALLLVASATLLIIALCLSGCATKKPVFVKSQPPAPPERSVTRAVTTIVVPSPPKIRYMSWKYPEDKLWEVSNFRVYYKTNLLDAEWTLFARVEAPTLELSFPQTNQQAFFICTTVTLDGTESGPNTK